MRMSLNYRLVNFALPSGGSVPASPHGKRQEAVPNSPSSTLSPSRSRSASAATARSALLVKPLCSQSPGVVNNALTVTGHQPHSSSSLPQAVVIYGQIVNAPKATAGLPSEHFRPRGSSSQDNGPSHTPVSTSSKQHLAPEQQQQPHGASPSLPSPPLPLSIRVSGVVAATPTSTTIAAVAVADDELTVLKEQILKLQRAIEALCGSGSGSGSGSASGSGPGSGSGALGGPAGALSGGAALGAAPALNYALWPASSHGSSSSAAGSSSSSSLGSLGSVGSGSSSSASGSSRNSSGRTSRSGEGACVGAAAPGSLASWSYAVATAGCGGGACLEALLQQACAPLAVAAAATAAAHAPAPPLGSAQPQQRQQQQQQQQQRQSEAQALIFASPYDAALTAARARLLDLFVRKAYQLLLEAAPELVLPHSSMFYDSDGGGVASGVDGPAGVLPGATGASKASSALLGKPPPAASPAVAGAAPALQPGLPATASPITNSNNSSSSNAASRVQSAPTGRGRGSASGGALPATAVATAASPSEALPGGSGSGTSMGSTAGVDLSPAGVLVAASRRLARLQAAVAGRDSRVAASEQQLADTRAKLESAMADNTLLRNMISELQANARPQSRNNLRNEAPRPSTPSPAPPSPPPPDPSLLRHISSLTSDLAAARGRSDEAQRRLDKSEAVLADLRRQLQEAVAARKAPATNSRGCQASLADPSAAATAAAVAGELAALRAAAAEAVALKSRTTQLETDVAEAQRAQRGLQDRVSQAEADLAKAAEEVRRLQAQAAERERGGAAAAAATDTVRQQLEAERQLVSELQAQLGRASSDAAAKLAAARARIAELEGQLKAATAAAAGAKEVHARLEAAAGREAAARREAEEAATAARKRAEAEAEVLRRRLTEAEAALAAARREATAAVEKGDRKRAELAARISSLDQDQRRLAEELKAARKGCEAARALAEQWEKEATLMRDEKFEASARLTAAQHDLEAERRRLAEELAATQRLRSQLMEDANAVKALGTLVQAKTLKLDIGGAAAAMVAAGGPGSGVGGSRPGTGDPAAHVRLTNLVKEQQEKLKELKDQLTSREDRCGRLQVALTAAQEALAQRDSRVAAAEGREAQLAAQLAVLKPTHDAQQAETSKLRQQFDELSRHSESVKAHNAELHKMAEKLQREGAAVAAEARELRAQLEAANQQLSDERARRQRLLDEVVALTEKRDSAASDVATLKSQRRADCNRLEELQAALLLATQKLAGAERTITSQDERIALLLARLRAAEERLGTLGVTLPPLPHSDGGGGSDEAPGGGGALSRAASSPAPSGMAGSGGAGGSGGLQPPVGSLSLAPQSVTAQQRLSQLLTGGAPMLGSMVQDMINKVMAAEATGTSAGGGRPAAAARGGRTGSALPSASRSVALEPQQQQQQQRASSHQNQLNMLLRPSSASVVGRVLEHMPSNLPGFGKQPHSHGSQSSGAAGGAGGSGWASGFGAGAGGSGLRPQSAWTQRGGAGGGSSTYGLAASAALAGGAGGAATPSSWLAGANLRRAASGSNQAAANGGAGGVSASGAGSGPGAPPDILMPSASPTKMLGTGSGASSSGGGGGSSTGGGDGKDAGLPPAPSSSSAVSQSPSRVGGGGGGRPGTAVSKKTVLLLSMSSPAGQLDEAVDDE